MAQNIHLGPKARLVVNAAIQELSPALEQIIAKICQAAGYQDKQGATASVIAALPPASTPVSAMVTPGLPYQTQPSGGPYPPPLPPPATYTPPSPVPALPPAGGGCSTGSCGIGAAKPQQNGGTNMSQKACCGSCATGGQCSCSASSLGCATGDTVNQTGQFQAQGPTGAPVNATCTLPPGFDNCLSHAGDLAPCDVDRIQRTRRRFVVQGQTDIGDLVDATIVLSPELDTPAGYAWYRIRVAEVNVSHQLCPREFQLEHNPDVAGAGAWTDVSGTIEEVAAAAEAIYQDGDGNFVHAWEFPKPADPDDLRITDGRCACERLCICVRYFGDGSISVLAPELGVGEAYRLTVKGIRDCWQIVCGACPPDDLCGRELL